MFSDDLQRLAENEGYSEPMEMLEDTFNDGAVPGACSQCDYTTYVEPDCTDGWCEECEAGTVRSCQIMAGII